MKMVTVLNQMAKCPACSGIEPYTAGMYEACSRCGEVFNPDEHLTGEKWETKIPAR